MVVFIENYCLVCPRVFILSFKDANRHLMLEEPSVGWSARHRRVVTGSARLCIKGGVLRAVET